MRFNFHLVKINFAFVLLIFSAFLNGVFSPVFASPPQFNAAETVFCPLTNKLQPVHPPKDNLLDAFCASDWEKENFSKAIIAQFTVRFNNFSRENLENFVFDYWQNEKTAFANLPYQPFSPEKTLAEKSFSKVGFTNKFDHQIVWKTANKFSFQLSKRPPPIQNNSKVELRNISELKKISRNINPRSPPIFS